ncbi:MAG: hypothetical protein BWY75_02503 [bacterium ADurb.Bin425]|nr:MAG: hypothetical protein BWY75_02503 [bacterium ADurb.Bin425]
MVHMHLNHRNAVHRLRLNKVDATGYRGDGSLTDGGDAILHLFSRQIVIAPNDAHNRHIDERKDVGGHAQSAKDAQNSKQKRRNHKGVRSSQG